MTCRIAFILCICLLPAALFGAGQKMDVFPPAPYDRLTVYEALVFFWIGITGLIVIIAMKLRELKRIREMGIDSEEKDAPFLD